MVMARSLCHLQASLTTAIWQTTDELAIAVSLSLFVCLHCQLKLLERTGTSPEAHRVIVGVPGGGRTESRRARGI